MNESQKKADGRLFCKHRMSLKKLKYAFNPRKVECENGCGVTWGDLIEWSGGKEIYLDVIE